jgi:hypothetical protein
MMAYEKLSPFDSMNEKSQGNKGETIFWRESKEEHEKPERSDRIAEKHGETQRQ